jgi:mersacidin/lichenicidin family type 2 lantibiotic
MRREDIVRAWKDPAYRASLSAKEREALPESPAGSPLAELQDEELRGIVGGMALTPRHSCIGRWCPADDIVF